MTNQIIKHTTLISAVLLPAFVSAQNNAGSSVFDSFDLDQVILLVGVAVLIGAFVTLIRVLAMLLKLAELRILKEKGIEEIVEQYQQPEEPMWSKLWTKLQGTVPIEEEKNIMFDHAYDGIHELDNNLPPWWLGMFYISIVIGVVYMYVYHMSDLGLSSSEKYELEMQVAQEDIEAYKLTQAEDIDETNVTLATDPAELAAGKELYIAQCVVCHGQGGEGGVGPNFADEYWIHGGDIKDLFRTIKYGVPEKGMISWSAQLPPKQMQQVASYILTLQGTDPPNQKAPEGTLWVPSQEEAMLQDTTTATGE